jgi:hypothetical protein
MECGFYVLQKNSARKDGMSSGYWHQMEEMRSGDLIQS